MVLTVKKRPNEIMWRWSWRLELEVPVSAVERRYFGIAQTRGGARRQAMRALRRIRKIEMEPERVSREVV